MSKVNVKLKSAKKPKLSSDSKSQRIAEVVIGTYEHHIAGFWLNYNSYDDVDDEEQQYELKASFFESAHTGSVKCITCDEKLLFSGSTDESIRIFDMVKRRENGSLMRQAGTITCLQTYANIHLFSSSEDGTICIWSTQTWECLKTLKGHNSGVNFISVHPSGKLLLSVSKDKTIRTWNLIKGRSAYVTNIKAVANIISWVPESSYFVVSFDRRLDVYDIEKGACIHSFDFDKTINCLTFLNDNLLLIGLDSGQIEYYDMNEMRFLFRFVAHDNRIKDISRLIYQDKYLLFTASSDGTIKVWKVSNITKIPELVTSVETSCRINCLTVHVLDPNHKNDD